MLKPHPHDQHARHNTHFISARGGKKREKPCEATSIANKGGNTAHHHRLGKVSKLQQLRDDFSSAVLSVKYTDPMLKLTGDRLTCTGYKGWSSVFSTHSADHGKWYFEATMLEAASPSPKFLHNYMGRNGIEFHVRVGWACRYQRYDTPIGQNAFSYALSDLQGEIVNNAIRESYLGRSIGVGDTIGCYLSLEEPTWWLSDPRQDRKIYEFLQDSSEVQEKKHLLTNTCKNKGYALAGILCNPAEPPNPPVNEGSFIEFSINGTNYGRAYSSIFNGSYHPAVALYMGARIKMNFGPEFKFFPVNQGEWRPACEMSKHAIQ